MTETITYSLRGKHPDSEKYYRDIAHFTDQVLKESEGKVRPIAEEFRNRVSTDQLEPPRTVEEYVLELLMLGLFWRIYSKRAIGAPEFPLKMLSTLGEVRETGGLVKAGSDRLRGLLLTLFLLPQSNKTPELKLEHYDKLLEWLHATGDFGQEVKRLAGWRPYLADLTPENRTELLTTALDFAKWFKEAGLETLGEYTEHVESFLTEVQNSRRWREDVISCGRQREEYHLNMVGAEVMSRAFAADFQKMPHKEVLLPGCMRANPKGCQLQQTPLGPRCTGCTPNCRIHQITKVGDRHNFGVLLILHSSELFKDWPEGEIGIVGVACVPTLLAGGLKAKSKGIPPMCVLLDHCGCQTHWHPQGIQTDINLDKLWSILGIPIGDEPSASSL